MEELSTLTRMVGKKKDTRKMFLTKLCCEQFPTKIDNKNRSGLLVANKIITTENAPL